METVGRYEAATLLHQYSEWLDSDNGRQFMAEDATHDDLVHQFLENRAEICLPQVRA